MKKIFNILTAALLALSFISGCTPKEQKLYILSLNDQHGNIDNYPQFAALVDSLRTVHPDLLLFSAGDNRSGNPVNDRYSDIARPMVELMNKVGFNLSCLGNHEWDAGVIGLRNVMGWANYPYVCANVTFDDSLKMPVKPFEIIEWNGLKLGVIGAIQLGENGLPDFHPKNVGGSHFRPANEVIPEYLYLKDECNALFLLSHCGYEDDRELAEQFPQFDAIFGGHTHTRVSETQIVNGVMITQAESKVKFVTLSTFTFKNGKIVDKQEELLSVRDFPHRNAEVQAMVDNYNNNEFFSTVKGYNLTAIDKSESVGCLMTDAFRFILNADFGFQNPGGVRYDTLSVRPVTMKDLLALDPFNNEIVQFNLTGEEIIRLMKCCYVTDHGPIYCSGCTYSYSEDENGEMTDIEVVLENGQPLDMAATYNVVMNSYMSSVFDYEHEDEGRFTFRTSNDLMLEYLSQHPDIDYGNTSRVTEK